MCSSRRVSRQHQVLWEGPTAGALFAAPVQEPLLPFLPKHLRPRWKLGGSRRSSDQIWRLLFPHRHAQLRSSRRGSSDGCSDALHRNDSDVIWSDESLTSLDESIDVTLSQITKEKKPLCGNAIVFKEEIVDTLMWSFQMFVQKKGTNNQNDFYPPTVCLYIWNRDEWVKLKPSEWFVVRRFKRKCAVSMRYTNLTEGQLKSSCLIYGESPTKYWVSND